MKRLSYYLTPRFVGPIIKAFFEDRVVPKMAELGETDAAVWVAIWTPDLPFEECILGTVKGNVDPHKPFEGPCNDIARSKCQISHRTGFSTREVTELHPELLLPGETAYAGSTISGNLVVAISGLPDYWDEALSIQLRAEIWARVMEAHRARRGKMQGKGRDFLPKR